jgi:hypothetical protein
VPLDAIAQLVAGDPQAGSRACHVPLRLLQRLQELLALDAPDDLLQARRRLSRSLGGRRRRLGLRQPRELELRRRHDLRLAEQRDALHRVGELADVAGPRVREQGPHRVRGEALRRQAVVLAGAGQEVLREQHDVPAAFPQRRQDHGDDRQALIEVLAEPPLAYRGREVLARRGQDPDVDRVVARGPESPHPPLLEGLQELRLEPLGQEADLVQEERPAVRRLEEARLAVAGIGEGAPLVAEQLGFQEGRRERRAVDVDEGPVGPGPGPVDRVGQEPLARPGLALDEHGREAPVAAVPAAAVPAEHPGDPVPDRDDRRALSKQLVQAAHSARLARQDARARLPRPIVAGPLPRPPGDCPDYTQASCRRQDRGVATAPRDDAACRREGVPALPFSEANRASSLRERRPGAGRA